MAGPNKDGKGKEPKKEVKVTPKNEVKEGLHYPVRGRRPAVVDSFKTQAEIDSYYKEHPPKKKSKKTGGKGKPGRKSRQAVEAESPYTQIINDKVEAYRTKLWDAVKEAEKAQANAVKEALNKVNPV
jgi:hypothetical protein